MMDGKDKKAGMSRGREEVQLGTKQLMERKERDFDG